MEPFEILKQNREATYRVALPPQMSDVHNIFHISMLRKYEPDPSRVLTHEELLLRDNKTYEEKAAKILGRKKHKLGRKVISLVKMLWKISYPEEATWEQEEEVGEKYPNSLASKQF